jgi:hypothetical protein
MDSMLSVFFEMTLAGPHRFDWDVHLDVTNHVRSWMFYNDFDKNGLAKSFIRQWGRHLNNLVLVLLQKMDQQTPDSLFDNEETKGQDGTTRTRSHLDDDDVDTTVAANNDDDNNAADDGEQKGSEDGRQQRSTVVELGLHSSDDPHGEDSKDNAPSQLAERWPTMFLGEWLKVADAKEALLLVNVCLMFIPLDILQNLRPELYLMLAHIFNDIMRLAIEAIRPSSHYQPLESLSLEKSMRLMQKQAAKERYKKETIESMSNLIFISLSTIFSIFSPWLNMITTCPNDSDVLIETKAVMMESYCKLICLKTFTKLPEHQKNEILFVIYHCLIYGGIQSMSAFCEFGNTIFRMEYDGIVPLSGVFLNAALHLLSDEIPTQTGYGSRPISLKDNRPLASAHLVPMMTETYPNAKKGAMNLITSMLIIPFIYPHVPLFSDEEFGQYYSIAQEGQNGESDEVNRNSFQKNEFGFNPEDYIDEQGHPCCGILKIKLGGVLSDFIQPFLTNTSLETTLEALNAFYTFICHVITFEFDHKDGFKPEFEEERKLRLSQDDEASFLPRHLNRAQEDEHESDDESELKEDNKGRSSTSAKSHLGKDVGNMIAILLEACHHEELDIVLASIALSSDLLLVLSDDLKELNTDILVHIVLALGVVTWQNVILIVNKAMNPSGTSPTNEAKQ